MRLWNPIAVIVVALILANCAVASAQEEIERKPVGGLAFLDEVEVTVVNIDVFVRDKNDRVVTDLTINDFEISQDGQQRNLTNFLFIDESYRTVAAGGAPPSVEPRGGEPGAADATAESVVARPEIKPIHLVVYIDDENLRPFDRNRVLGHVRRFLQNTVRPGVEAMIVSHQASAKIVQSFTSDQRELADALRGLRKQTGARLNRDSERKALMREIDRLRGEEGNAVGGRPLSQDAGMVYDRVVTYAEAVAMETVRDLGAVSQLSSTLTGLPGRKYLIYVSSGLPMVPGKDLFYEMSQLYQGVSYSSLLARFNLRREYQSMISTANAQGVTIYTIDAEGNAPDAGISAERATASDPTAEMIGSMNYEEPLFYLAERTGGLAVVGSNDFAGGLEMVRQDLFSYYSVGYQISATGGDRVHRIEVKLPNHPNLELRYRQTFVEKSRQSQVQDTVMSALLFEIDENAMGVGASVGEPSPSHEGRWLLPLSVSVPTASIALLPQGESLAGEIVVFVALRGIDGHQSDLQLREQSIEIPRAEYESLADRDITVDLQLLVESGRYRVAVGLLDRVTRQASYEVLTTSTPDD